MDESAALHRAREAIARGDREAARHLLADVLYEQPGSETAWMMLSTVVDQPDHKRDCLERVLRIHPDNEAAREQLAALDAAQAPPVEAKQEAPAALPETPLLEGEVELATSQPSPSAASQEDPTQLFAPEPAAEDTAVAVEEETVAGASHPLPGAVEDALIPPLGEPVPELQGQPLSRLEPASPHEAVPAGSRFLARTLAPGEAVLQRSKLSLGVFVLPLAAVFAAAVLFFLPAGDLDPRLVLAIDSALLASALVYLGLRAIRYFGAEYVVTDRRVLARHGLFARRTIDIPLSDIEEVTVGRGLFGSARVAGNVWIRRTDRTSILLWYIRRPRAFREAIERGRVGASGTGSFHAP
jgi:membrane protein YdbS with pleckstrin-like domain